MAVRTRSPNPNSHCLAADDFEQILPYVSNAAGGGCRQSPAHLRHGSQAALFLSRRSAMEDLKTGTEYDPERAEEFVACIRALRTEGSRPAGL